MNFEESYNILTTLNQADQIVISDYKTYRQRAIQDAGLITAFYKKIESHKNSNLVSDEDLNHAIGLFLQNYDDDRYHNNALNLYQLSNNKSLDGRLLGTEFSGMFRLSLAGIVALFLIATITLLIIAALTTNPFIVPALIFLACIYAGIASLFALPIYPLTPSKDPNVVELIEKASYVASKNSTWYLFNLLEMHPNLSQPYLNCLNSDPAQDIQPLIRTLKADIQHKDHILNLNDLNKIMSGYRFFGLQIEKPAPEELQSAVRTPQIST